jgi:hypothetical protein
MEHTTPSAPVAERSNRIRPNVRLYTFVSKVITPAVLLAGLLVLAVFHFSGVLANTQSIDNIYHGEQAYSKGPMAYTFQELAGTDRPDINYNGISLLTYVDWSSTMSIDGHVSNLWDNFHGYDYDRTNPNDTEFFSTTTGTGWQLIEVTRLTSDHSMTVSYSFVARTETLAEPHHVSLTIEHVHQSMYQPTVHNNIFTAGVLSHEMDSVTSGDTPTPLGTITVSVQGPAVPATSIVLDTARGNKDANGTGAVLTDSFQTNYVIQDPDVNRMTPLGTETINFTPTVSVGTPVSAPLPVITPTP